MTEHASDSVLHLKRELDGIASEAFEILNETVGRSKLNLTTQTDWNELLELTCSTRFEDRIPRDSLTKLRHLHARWKYLFTQLRFAASTRPVWNT